MPSRCTCKTSGRAACLRHQGQEALSLQMRDAADPDGAAVFGRFPDGWYEDVLRFRMLGDDVGRDEVLHVCAGTLCDTERWTVDIRPGACPLVIADGEALPFSACSFKAVLLDPPYSEAYARQLYRTKYPRPSYLLREAARVVRHGGRIGLKHVNVPITPVGCNWITAYGVVPAPGFRICAFTIYEKLQVGLFAGGAAE